MAASEKLAKKEQSHAEIEIQASKAIRRKKIRRVAVINFVLKIRKFWQLKKRLNGKRVFIHIW